VCQNNILYLNFCLLAAGLPLPGPQYCTLEEQAEYGYNGDYNPHADTTDATSESSCEVLKRTGLKFALNNQPGFETVCGASKIPASEEMFSATDTDSPEKECPPVRFCTRLLGSFTNGGWPP
jgi:hypothetical protein